MIHKRILLLAALFLFGGPELNAAEIPDPTDVFVDAERGYHFRHPVDWKANLYRSGVIVSEVNHPDGNSGVQFRVDNLAHPIRRYAAHYVKKTARELNGRILKNKKIILNELPCLELEMAADRGRKDYYLYQLVYFLRDVHKVIIIQAGCEMADRDTLAPIIHGIAKSLRIDDVDKL